MSTRLASHIAPAAAGFVLAPVITHLLVPQSIPAIAWERGQPEPAVVTSAKRANAIASAMTLGVVGLAALGVSAVATGRNNTVRSAAAGAAIGSLLAGVLSLATAPPAPPERPFTPPAAPGRPT